MSVYEREDDKARRAHARLCRVCPDSYHAVQELFWQLPFRRDSPIVHPPRLDIDKSNLFARKAHERHNVTQKKSSSKTHLVAYAYVALDINECKRRGAWQESGSRYNVRQAPCPGVLTRKGDMGQR